MRFKTAIVIALTTILATMGLSTTSAEAATAGVNDWSCQPSAAHPQPVVLLHGLGGSKDTNWTVQGPALVRNGYCVFSLTYGQGFAGPLAGGFASMRDSSKEVGAFVDRVRNSTRAGEVDLVGHSEGTTVSAYYLKFDGGAAKVRNFVGFGSNFKGSTLGGLNLLINALRTTVPAVGTNFSTYCASCLEFIAPSSLLDDLNAGGVTVPGVNYTSIMSKLDEVVVPYTSGRLAPAPNVTNIVLQDRCKLDLAGHLAMAVDPNITNAILDGLEPGKRHGTCVPFFAPL